jgi:hypothetical protein
MTKKDGDLYAVEPNHGELVKVTTSGKISRVIDVSASQGHVVPTVITKNNGNFFVGTPNLGVTITDEDEERGIVFFSARPGEEHHEFVLQRGRTTRWAVCSCSGKP